MAGTSPGRRPSARPALLMPSKPLRPCTHHGCPALVQYGACPTHRQQRDQQRGTAAQRGYGARHREWRAQVFRVYPNCVDCGAMGRPDDHADHAKRIRDGGARFDVANGRRRCESCHNAKSAREGAADRARGGL